jgi:serine/threonine protein phosphatase 1
MDPGPQPRRYRRIYAIGDIHGRSDLLEQMVAAIARDLERGTDGSAGCSAADAVTITLGDYLDRGPDSCGVLDRLARNPFPTPYIALKGNHEELFEAFLRNPAVGAHWLQLGGLETLRSYDASLVPLMLRNDFEVASDRLRAAIPLEHVRFLASLRLSFDHERNYFCHAGVRPGIALDQQSQRDLLWIRQEFLASKVDFGKVVVHGHTPVDRPELLANRINVDTAAFATGRLTCVVLNDNEPRFLST